MPADHRKDYLNYDQLTEWLQHQAATHPDLVRLTTLGQSPEGRELWLLTVGSDPDRIRPTVWVDANMHATEFCGTNVALAITEAVVNLHRGESTLPAAMVEAIRRVRFFILPRMAPDAADQILKDGRFARSVPRQWKTESQHPHWVVGDVDGDGLSMVMRQLDPSGDFVESTTVPGLMVPRLIDDPGPAYRLYPEGHINNFDGDHIPDASFLSDNGPDLNRNFPWSWVPEHEQMGAGPFPGSEPESQAVLRFTSKHPEIFVWMNLHTFGGVYIRPLGHLPDNKMNQQDLAIYRQIEQWGEALTGYPTVSGYEEFTYLPEQPIHGDLTDYAYHQRGAVALVCELWDLFQQAGFERVRPFVHHYSRLDRAEMEQLGQWAKEHAPDVIRPWHPVEHPQLGQVEVGGVDPRFGLRNPPRPALAELCDNQVQMLMHLAALPPHVVFEDVRAEPLGDGAWEVRGNVRNIGYLPTFGLHSAKDKHWNEPLSLQIDADGTAPTGPSLMPLGHLEGWGHGRHQGGALFFQASSSNATTRSFRITTRGPGRLSLTAKSSRLGAVSHSITLG